MMAAQAGMTTLPKSHILGDSDGINWIISATASAYQIILFSFMSFAQGPHYKSRSLSYLFQEFHHHFAVFPLPSPVVSPRLLFLLSLLVLVLPLFVVCICPFLYNLHPHIFSVVV